MLQEPVRRILGPRPLMNRLSSQPALGDSQYSSGSSPLYTSDSVLRGPQTLSRIEDDIALNEASKSFSPYKDAAPRNGYITLIRRDPATNNQWNIGRLSLLEPKSPHSPNRSPKRRSKDVLIELSVPGYVRFSDKAGDSETAVFARHLEFSHAANLGSSTQSSSTTLPTIKSLQPTFLTPWQTSCVFQTAVTGRTLKCYHNLPGSLLRPSSWTGSGERPQTALVSELRFNLPQIVEKSTMKKKENRRPVSFQAHSYGSHGSHNRSPNRLARSDSYEQEEVPSILSERLPSQATLETPPILPLRPREFPLSTSHNRAHSDNSISTYQHMDNTEMPLDLSLGQERAGGGFNGNKAKLGKLIIYGGQGLAMLDLLVAANMSVWFNDVLEY